jgi:uncharacterized membrane protein YoaK (UPF0700 family)
MVRCGDGKDTTAASAVVTRDALLLLLAATSGYVDAVSYLGLGHVFTANMTGNTVLLGLALAQVRGLAALRSGVALAGFAAGVAIGSVVVEQDEKRIVWPPRVTAACALECVALLGFAIGGYLTRTAPDGRAIYPLIVVSALAMGLQSVAVRSLGVTGVATTYITGTWTSLVAGLATRLREARLSGAPSAHTPQPRGVGLQAAVVVSYGLAAVGGGAAETIWHLAAIVVPAAAVALVVVVALLRFQTTPERRDKR